MVVDIVIRVTQIIYENIANHLVHDARHLAPGCLPQRCLSAPCSPGAAFGFYAFDLPGVMVDPTRNFEGRIDFSPCSQGVDLPASPGRGFNPRRATDALSGPRSLRFRR